MQGGSGFKHTPDIPQGSGMARWHEALLALVHLNAGTVAGVFRLPNSRLAERGTRVQI